MKYLALADRPAEFSVLTLIEKYSPEIIITLGDLSQNYLRDLEYVTLPKIGVRGNHDSYNYFSICGIINNHAKITTINGIKFGGLEGCIRYKDSEYAPMYSQDEYSEILKDFPSVDIFISHSPPYGINDEKTEIAHQGIRALNEYLERISPRYFMHGHTYPSNPLKYFGNTEIIYVSGFAVGEFKFCA